MARKKELPLLQNITITDIGSEGNALARVDNMVVFVPMLIPGDVVDIQVIRKRKKYMEGKVVRFVSFSPQRIDAICSHFGICGGCKWQHLPYEQQLKIKEKQVYDNLSRIGKTDIPTIRNIIGSPSVFHYRNKLEFTFSNKRWLTKSEIDSDKKFDREDALGFHIPGLFDKVLDIERCYLQPEPSNEIRNAVRSFAIENELEFFDLREQKGFLRNLIVRNSLSGDVMVIVVFYNEDEGRRTLLLDFLASHFPAIKSLWYVINSKRNDSLNDQEPVPYSGADHLIEYMDDLRFRIGPKSFYQTNTNQALTLYRIAREFADLKGDETVYDLYTGTGTIANFVSSYCKKVVGIEYVSEAIEDAEANSRFNSITNCSFFAGDMREVLTNEFFETNGFPDVIITDPPRAGMHEDVAKVLLRSGAGKIVYVSCNPATQARDIQLLSESYYVEAVQPVDMFPHTHHVENVVLLRRR